MSFLEEIDRIDKTKILADGKEGYEERQALVWDVVTKDIKGAIEYYRSDPENGHEVLWPLAHIESHEVKKLFIKLARNKYEHIRKYALINLQKYNDKDLIDLFVLGLKDRSIAVKGEALDAVKNIRDKRIKKALEHLVSLKSFKVNSPGYYDEATKILKKY